MFGVEVKKGIHLGPVVHTSLKLRATGKPRDDMMGVGDFFVLDLANYVGA